MTLGERIRKMREQAGLSRDEFARLLGVATMTVYFWETGRRKPRPPTLKAIESLLEEIAPSKEERVKKSIEILEKAGRLRAEIRRKIGRDFPDSAEVIREMREERGER